jgi:hypothetical protein
MLRATASKVMWVGRATVFLVGLSVILAVVFGVASAAFGANGGNFILGQNNTASLLTKLTGQVPGGAALQVVNTKTEPGSRGLQINVAENKPPIAVNATAGKAPNLNADELDGKSEADFYAAGSKVADSAHADQADSATSAEDANTLDGKDSTEFLGATQKAADSELLDGIDSTDFAKAYKRTVVVSPVGTDTENGQALLDAISGITDASASKPYLLHIEPATYDLGNGSLTMKPWVDIEGSGELNTVITSGVDGGLCGDQGTVNGADNAEMRFLTVRNTASFCSTAIKNNSASPRLTHLTAESTGGSPPNSLRAAVLNNNSSPTMTDVTATASGASFAYAVFQNASSPTMTDVTATASGGTSANYGLFVNTSSSPTIRQSKFSGSTASLRYVGGTATVAFTQLVGPVIIAAPGGTLQCFNNYNQNMAAVSCP